MFPWASSQGSDFNPDFNVYFTEAQQRRGTIDYNYGARSRHRAARRQGRDELGEAWR